MRPQPVRKRIKKENHQVHRRLRARLARRPVPPQRARKRRHPVTRLLRRPATRRLRHVPPKRPKDTRQPHPLRRRLVVPPPLPLLSLAQLVKVLTGKTAHTFMTLISTNTPQSLPELYYNAGRMANSAKKTAVIYAVASNRSIGWLGRGLVLLSRRCPSHFTIGSATIGVRG